MFTCTATVVGDAAWFASFATSSVLWRMIGAWSLHEGFEELTLGLTQGVVRSGGMSRLRGHGLFVLSPQPC